MGCARKPEPTIEECPSSPFRFDVVPVLERASKANWYWVDLVLETSSGALFHASSEPNKISLHAWLEEPLSRAMQAAADSLWEQLSTGAAIGEHLLDQLILPLSLASGRSCILSAAPSLHAETAMRLAERFLPDVRFKQWRVGELYKIEVVGVGRRPTMEWSASSDTLPLPPP